MAAYLKALTLAKCACGKRVEVEVFNKFNASNGRWCRACGEQMVKQLNSGDAAGETTETGAAKRTADRKRR